MKDHNNGAFASSNTRDILDRTATATVTLLELFAQLQLTIALERAGFVEGTHFANQLSGENEDGERRIADTVLWLPGQQSLVIDAKVTLPSWNSFSSAAAPEDREVALKAMIASVKAHYIGLSKKEYAQVVGKGQTVPFTIMFIPIEPAGLEVLRAAPEVFSEGDHLTADHGVAECPLCAKSGHSGH